MLKYHLSPKTGNPGICKAKYKCAYGDIETEHYSSPGIARAAYEQKMQSASLAASPSRMTIQSAEKFQEILQDYSKKNPRAAASSWNETSVSVSGPKLLKCIEEANNSGDRYFEPGSIHVYPHPGSLSVTAKDSETGEEVHLYVNTDSGFAFYGDDPQDDARDDLTFRTVFSKLEDYKSVEGIADGLFDLYEDRESKSGKWDSDIESIKFNYVQCGHFEVNEALRSDSGLSKAYIDSIDAISREDTLEEAVTVYRGVPRKAAKPYLDSLKRGEGISDAALLSTSVDPRVAKNFASKDGYVFAIKLPKGQKCLNLSKDGNEGEILLPRNTTLENIQIFDTKDSENA